MSIELQANSTTKMQIPPGPIFSTFYSAGALFVGGNIEKKILDKLVKKMVHYLV